ncbi:hypothetical protein HUB97_10140 [Halorubraceae archaeon YAN]|nr:hypothetical protein [Halorubraceae archaeon YAN]
MWQLLITFVLLVAAGCVGAISVLMIQYPEIALRVENLGEVDSVELSEYGIMKQQAGGILLFLFSPIVGYLAAGTFGMAAPLLGAAAVVVWQELF